MGISDAKKVCPELILVDGEDLSAFRDVSKKMYGLLRSFSWNRKLERLGLDEYFMDVTDMVDYNVELLNRNALDQSFFCLSKDDPEKGFAYDASSVAGCVYGSPVSPGPETITHTQYLRLIAASHLARYIRMQIEEQGYTTAAGISTNKLLAKLVGNLHKPRNQTSLLAFTDEQVRSFMDTHKLRKIPGIGSRTTGILESKLLSAPNLNSYGKDSPKDPLTAGYVRNHPTISPSSLEKLLSAPGTERGLGEKTWSLLHGVDNTPVKPASDVPTQISIEDTYQGLNEPDQITTQLRLLSTSLLRRMHIDLLDEGRWIAHPKTIRLTTRPYRRDKPYNWNRASRSVPLPGWAFSLNMPREDVVSRLVDEVLLPMFRRLNPGPRGWQTGLLNVCVANMVVVAGTGEGAGAGGVGRDIGVMFRRQEDVLRDFTVYEEEVDDEDPGVEDDELEYPHQGLDADVLVKGSHDKGEEGSDVEWEEDDRDALETCTRCGHLIPSFALVAHERYHDMEP
jgi:DNA polymerase iota